MSRAYGREETMRIAAEKMRRKREQEEREDQEFYERITSGWRWNLLRVVAIFCTIVALATTIDTFVDGSTRKLKKNEWQYDREWRMDFHKIIRVEGCMFTPHLRDWYGAKEGSFEITYSPIFQTGKYLSYTIEEEEGGSKRRHSEYRTRSLFNWFPFFQIFTLIPIATLFYKRKNSFFNFARVASLAVVFPGTLIAMYFFLI